jgi:hypothetical protein
MNLSVYKQKELNFVELNTTGTETYYNKIDPESLYMDASVFNLFSKCFEKANRLYEYYAATKYSTRCIVPLRNQLMIHLAVMENIRHLDGFRTFIEQKLLGNQFLLSLVQTDKHWDERWTVYHQKLLGVNRHILDLVDFCIDEDRILWVIGY